MGKSSSKSAPSRAAAPAPASVGSATVTASAQQPNASEGKGPDLPREPLVLDWDPQNLGAEASWEGEHGTGNDPTTDTQTGKRGKARKESREAGSATIEDSDGEVEWGDMEQARHDRRFPGGDDTEAAAADDEGEAGDAAQTAEQKASRAEKRERVLKALQRQKQNLGAENAARDERTKREAAERRAAEAEAQLAKLKGGGVADRLANLGLTKQDLVDAAILGNNGAAELTAAAKENGATTAELAQLRADFKALKDELAAERATKTQREVQAQIAESHTETARIIEAEKLDVPLVLSEGAFDRVLQGAWEAWRASGKAGAVKDYVPAAAEVIEELIEQEKPRLAALKKAAKRAPKDEETEERPAAAGRTERKIPRAAVGRRTGPSRVANRRDSLAGVTDGHERDRIIAREMGWTTH